MQEVYKELENFDMSGNIVSRLDGGGRPTCITIGYSGPRAKWNPNRCFELEDPSRVLCQYVGQCIKIGFFGTVRLGAQCIKIPQYALMFLDTPIPNVLRQGKLPQCPKIWFFGTFRHCETTRCPVY